MEPTASSFKLHTVLSALNSALSRQISAAARSVLHCVFSRLELVGRVLDQLAIQLSLY